MTLTAWRICKRRLARTAFSGEGARRFGGRWNSPGTAIVYTAHSQSLAALELLVHLETPDLLARYVMIPVEFEESLVQRLDRKALPHNWRSAAPVGTLRALGDEWAAKGGSCVLEVPSALVPAESNYLLNPKHPDFARLKTGKPFSFEFDVRLKK